MSLLHRIRKGEVPPPTRRKFNEGAFLKIAEDPNASPEDRRLAQTALWIAGRLQALRSGLRLVDTNYPLSAAARLRALIAMCNRECAAAAARARQAFLSSEKFDGRLMIDIAVGSKIELPSGVSFSVDEIFQSFVDAAQLPIKALIPLLDDRQSTSLKGVNWDDVLYAVNVGIAYPFVEDAWDMVVWRDYRMVDSPMFDLAVDFVPIDLSQIDLQVVSEYRETVLRSELVGHAISALRTVDGLVESAVADKLEVVSVQRNGKRLRLCTGPVEASEARAADVLVAELLVPEYYRGFLVAPAPSYPALSLGAVLGAWRVLRSISELFWRPSVEAEMEAIVSRSKGAVDIAARCRVVPVADLELALVECLSVSTETSRSLIEFFTFSGRASQELWTQPLVRVGRSAVAPVLPALSSANAARNVDVWLQQLGYDMSSRGGAFETHLLSEISSLADEGRAAADLSAIGSFVFRPASGCDEEIDLVVVFGPLVFVVEAKCTVRPITDQAWFRYSELLRDAANQVLRKSEAIEANREHFSAQAKSRGLRLPESYVVMPMVLLSSPLLAGQIIDGVAVVDERILMAFLRNSLPRQAHFGPNGLESETELSFFSAVQEIPKAASEYFANPPQVAHLRDALKWRLVPSPLAPGDGYRGVILMTREVLLTGESLQKILGKEKTQYGKRS